MERSKRQRSYRDLTVWQKSMELVVEVYKLTQGFPDTEKFGLVSQMRRAAVSIPSNIAEGSRRRGKDVKQFLLISYGSGSELETQIELGRRLFKIDKKHFSKSEKILDEVMKMLNVMINK